MREAVASGRVFVNRLNLIKIDIAEQHNADAIVESQRVSKRPNADSAFKFISTNNILTLVSGKLAPRRIAPG